VDVVQPLNEVFATGSHVRVLRVLHDLPPGVSLSARQVAVVAGVSHPTVLRVTASLIEQGIVRVARRPRLDRYELEREHLLAPVLAKLFEAEDAALNDVIAFLAHRLGPGAPKVREAYVFGSVARGDSTRTSDLDLALITDDGGYPEDELSSLATDVKARFGFRLEVVVGRRSIEHMSEAGRDGDTVWRRIAEEGRPVLSSKGLAP